MSDTNMEKEKKQKQKNLKWLSVALHFEEKQNSKWKQAGDLRWSKM